MKALSIKQPFAELILRGIKKIELRKWNTHFRGEFYIHASQKPNKKAMERFGFENLPCGCVIGKVTLKDVKKYENEREHQKDKDLHLANSYWGNYGFVLENPIKLNLIPVQGRLGFWNFNLSCIIP